MVGNDQKIKRDSLVYNEIIEEGSLEQHIKKTEDSHTKTKSIQNKKVFQSFDKEVNAENGEDHLKQILSGKDLSDDSYSQFNEEEKSYQLKIVDKEQR